MSAGERVPPSVVPTLMDVVEGYSRIRGEGNASERFREERGAPLKDVMPQELDALVERALQRLWPVLTARLERRLQQLWHEQQRDVAHALRQVLREELLRKADSVVSPHAQSSHGT